jgi:DNA-binding transcriptional regulator YhcF (GntR family)
MTSKADAGSRTWPKYLRVATRVRDQIAEGTLVPGECAPSGAMLARATGYSIVTCRKALRALLADGVLVSGSSRGARPRVPPCTPSADEQTATDAARALSTGLATRRRAAGLTQPQLADLVGLSATTIGHAETGRLWQSRGFWELADKALSADGELLTLHDAYRAATVPTDPATVETGSSTQTAEITETDVDGGDDSPDIPVAADGLVASVTITWADGTATTVYPPPAQSTGQSRPRREQ